MKSIEYKIVKKLHLMEIHMHTGDKIDVVGYCNTVALQHVLAQLDLDQRMTIVCLKALFKKLRLIDTKVGRLPSSCIGIALLCANNDKEYTWMEESFFAQLCHYIGDFDFDEEQMTTFKVLVIFCFFTVIFIIFLML